MIERSVRPTRGVVAGRALRHGEACGDVIRDAAAQSLRAVPVLEVARGVAAVSGLDGQRVAVADVAGHTGSGRRRHMHAGQGEARNAVIEGSEIGPRDGVVAIRAIRSGERGASRGVHRVVGLLPVSLVAELVSASGGRGGEIVTASSGSVALRALHAGMRIGEWEPGGVVIKGGVGPTGGVVAGGALRHGEARSDVIRYAATQSLRAVPVFEVARGVAAIGGLDGQRVAVADVAGHTGSGRRGDVHAGQGEAGDGVIEGGHVGPGNVVVAIRAV